MNICTELDRAKMLIAINMGDALFNEVNIHDFKNAMMEEYGFNEDDLQYISEWYMHYGLLAAFKFNEIDLWTFYQSKWPLRNSNYLAQHEPEVCSRIYRRIVLLMSRGGDPQRGNRPDHHRVTHLLELRRGEERRLAELGHVGEEVSR